MRIGRKKILRAAIEVGEVAASAAGNQYLLSDSFGPLQHGCTPSALAGFHGAHESGCSAAKNNYVKLTFHEKGISDAARPQPAPPGRASSRYSRSPAPAAIYAIFLRALPPYCSEHPGHT